MLEKLIPNNIDFSALNKDFEFKEQIIRQANPEKMIPLNANYSLSLGPVLLNFGQFSINGFDYIGTVNFLTPFKENTTPIYLDRRIEMNPYIELTDRMKKEYIVLNGGNSGTHLMIYKPSTIYDVLKSKYPNAAFLNNILDLNNPPELNWANIFYRIRVSRENNNNTYVFNLNHRSFDVAVDHIPFLSHFKRIMTLENGRPTDIKALFKKLQPGDEYHLGVVSYFAIGLK